MTKKESNPGPPDTRPPPPAPPPPPRSEQLRDEELRQLKLRVGLLESIVGQLIRYESANGNPGSDRSEFFYRLTEQVELELDKYGDDRI